MKYPLIKYPLIKIYTYCSVSETNETHHVDELYQGEIEVDFDLFREVVNRKYEGIVPTLREEELHKPHLIFASQTLKR